MLKHADELQTYCYDGWLPISNIKAEHVAITIAIATKNFMFSDTVAGAEARGRTFYKALMRINNTNSCICANRVQLFLVWFKLAKRYEMKGAIFYASRYGSTKQYANWISEATGLPVNNMKNTRTDPASFDFLVLGCPVIYHKLFLRKWIQRNLDPILTKPTILFTVSGASAGSKLDGWIEKSLPDALITHVTHIALLGRQNPKELTIFDRVMLIIGGLKNPDPVASREELKGFDFMDKSSIEPIISLIKKLRLQDKPISTS